MPDDATQFDLNNIAPDATGAPSVLSLSQDDEKRFATHKAVATDFLKIDIDEANMYVAPLPITNASEDRDGEVTDPDGLRDAAYRMSPVVFFNHSHRFAPMLPAIGTAETPDRKYDVHKTATGWSAGTRFAQSHRLGSQCFAMVAEGILRARSIGALNYELTPYKPQAAGVTFHQGRIVPTRTRSIVHKLYELVEFSWVFIPSNREMVIEAKGLLSRNEIQGERLDPGLQMVLKGLDLEEPTSSAQHTSGFFAKGYDRAFGSQEKQMDSKLVAVRFATEKFSPASAIEMLKSHEFLSATPLQTEEVDGALFLRSSQLEYDGETEAREDERVPGLQLVFSKGGFYGKDPEQEQSPDKDGERAAVEEIIQQAADGVKVNEGAAGEDVASQVPEVETEDQDSADTQEDVAVVDVEEELTGPIGSRYLRMLHKKLSDVMDLAEASTDDLEPEMTAKCGEIASGLREKIEEIKAFHGERYGTGDEADTDEDSVEETGDPKDAEMRKSVQQDLFFGRRHTLPSGFLKSIRSACESLAGVAEADGARQGLSMVLKGLAEPVRPSATVVLSSSEKERLVLEELARRLMTERAESSNSEIA